MKRFGIAWVSLPLGASLNDVQRDWERTGSSLSVLFGIRFLVVEFFRALGILIPKRWGISARNTLQHTIRASRRLRLRLRCARNAMRQVLMMVGQRAHCITACEKRTRGKGQAVFFVEHVATLRVQTAVATLEASLGESGGTQ